jgi:hypothetical protein
VITSSSESALVGRFTWNIEADRWTGGRGLLLVHGLDPDKHVPRIDDLMAQKHPDDFPTVAAAIERAILHCEHFRCLHRIVHPDGAERLVSAVGQVARTDSGAKIMSGYFVDLTGYEPDSHVHRQVEDLQVELGQLHEAMRNRPVLEQAKGMIMMLYRCDPDTAWRVLVRTSQHTNLKVRTVARQFVDTATGVAGPDGQHVLAEVRRSARALGVRRT